ncbi:MAG: H-NS histone family protein [Vampirovibrionales bacterium]|nr:H-NS histone family protein [Vampirovibrionales bacterium]
MEINELTIPELKALSEQCGERIKQLKDGEISKLRDEFEAKAETLGMTASGVLAFDAKRRRAPGTPKYRNPADPQIDRRGPLDQAHTSKFDS